MVRNSFNGQQDEEESIEAYEAWPQEGRSEEFYDALWDDFQSIVRKLGGEPLKLCRYDKKAHYVFKLPEGKGWFAIYGHFLNDDRITIGDRPADIQQQSIWTFEI